MWHLMGKARILLYQVSDYALAQQCQANRRPLVVPPSNGAVGFTTGTKFPVRVAHGQVSPCSYPSVRYTTLATVTGRAVSG